MKMNKTQIIKYPIIHEKSKSGFTIQALVKRPSMLPMKIISINASRNRMNRRTQEKFYTTLSGKDFSLKRSKFMCTSGEIFSNEKIKSSIGFLGSKKNIGIMKGRGKNKRELKFPQTSTPIKEFIFNKQSSKNSKELLLHKVTPLPFLKIVPELRTRMQRKSKRTFSSELHRYKAKTPKQITPILRYLLNIQPIDSNTTKHKLSFTQTQLFSQVPKYHTKNYKLKNLDMESLELKYSKLHFSLLKHDRLEVKSQLK